MISVFKNLFILVFSDIIMNILGLIAARGGSKGLKNKNLLYLGEKSLIEYSINDAIQSKKFDKIVVSTDDKIIAKVSKNTGAEVPFLRPKNLAKDNSTMFEVVSHTINYLQKHEKYFPDIVVLMQPTSPFREKNLIKKSLQLLIKSKATSVISVAESKEHPFISFFKRGKFLEPLKKNHLNYSLRQKRTPVYYPTGSLYTFWAKNLKTSKSLYGTNISPIIIKDKFLNHDIDDLYDFFLADMTQKYWKNYKNPKIQK